eukprot:CAMPEP_0185769252 /NCGR_PEP_ID=MMETSP1174-20130828/53472_1 /TAXON_ID=35687 /ORGANISM="Dictyocha speculum, Strain CCMP1381" /LENGTH=614 /DNA_ID=CAMNT_0028454245 /DNA_START=34 /DNA_END=1875 /DNA_ORIENTATION=-
MSGPQGGAEVQLELEHAIGYSGGKICWHPNGKNYVYAARASLFICNLEDPHEQSFLLGHDDEIICIDLSSSGRYIVSGQRGPNADAIVWDFKSEKLMYRLCEHDYGVTCAAFSHDEKLIVTVGDPRDMKILVWDNSNGYLVAMVNQNPHPCVTCTWGGMVKNIKRRDTDKYLLCTTGNMKICLWSVDPYAGEMTGQMVKTDGRGALARELNQVAFSADRETVYGASTTGDFVVVTVKKGLLVKAQSACRIGIMSILTTAEGGLIVGGGDGVVTTFDAQLHEAVQVQLTGAVTSLCYSPDLSEIIAGTSAGYIYRLRSGNLKERLICENHCGAVKRVAFSPEASDRFATISTDNTIRVWDVSTYSVLMCVRRIKDAGEPACLIYTLDFLVSGWADGRIRSHHSDTGEDLWTIDCAHRGGVTAAVLSGNERFIMTGGQEGDVRIWEVRTRELVSHLKIHTSVITDVKLYDDDFHALSCSRDRAILCWDLQTEHLLNSHNQRMGGINAIALSADQTMILTVGQEKRVTMWDLRDQNPIHVQDLSVDLTDEGLALAVSHDGTVVATGGSAKKLKLWKFPELTLIEERVGHSGFITDIKFSPDDKQLVSVGMDGAIIVW